MGGQDGSFNPTLIIAIVSEIFETIQHLSVTVKHFVLIETPVHIRTTSKLKNKNDYSHHINITDKYLIKIKWHHYC